MRCSRTSTKRSPSTTTGATAHARGRRTRKLHCSTAPARLPNRLERRGREAPTTRRRMTRMEETFPFTLHGQEGTVAVEFRENDDPDRWGYRILDLPWPSSLAKGLPVMHARVSTPLEGYAAVMAWIQVV